MRDRLVIAACLLALALGVWAFLSLSDLAGKGGESAPLYSVRRYDPYGLAALSELLQKRGLAVHDLERPRLEPGDRGVLIQVIPWIEPPKFRPPGWAPQPPETQLPTQALLDWISQGNTVVQFTRQQTGLMRRCGVACADASPDFDRTVTLMTEHELKGQSPEDAYISSDLAFPVDEKGRKITTMRLSMRSPAAFVPRPGTRWRALAQTSRGDVAGELKVGAGRLIVVGSPSPALNYDLGRGDDLQFVLGIVGHGPVIFDEWSHGIHATDSIMALMRELGLMPMLLQLVFVLALYVWSARGHRRLDLDPPAQRRSSVEQIQTLGHLYGQTLGDDMLHGLVNREVRRRLAQALRCRPEQVEARLANLAPEPKARAARLLDTLARAEPMEFPVCLKCGYNLTGNQSNVCPECGTTVPHETRLQIAVAGPRSASPGPDAGAAAPAPAS